MLTPYLNFCEGSNPTRFSIRICYLPTHIYKLFYDVDVGVYEKQAKTYGCLKNRDFLQVKEPPYPFKAFWYKSNLE